MKDSLASAVLPPFVGMCRAATMPPTDCKASTNRRFRLCYLRLHLAPTILRPNRYNILYPTTSSYFSCELLRPQAESHSSRRIIFGAPFRIPTLASSESTCAQAPSKLAALQHVPFLYECKGSRLTLARCP